MASSFLDLDSRVRPSYYQHFSPRHQTQHRHVKNLTMSVRHAVRHAVLTPTWAGHKTHFCTLLHSLVRNAAHAHGDDPVLFLSVFSAVEDRTSILGQCPLPPRTPAQIRSVLTLRSLVFRVAPRYVKLHNSRWDASARDNFKFNFQTAKKFWALSQVATLTELVLVLDSDFVLVQRVDLREMIERYSSVVYLTGVTQPGFDGTAIKAARGLLGSPQAGAGSSHEGGVDDKPGGGDDIEDGGGRRHERTRARPLLMEDPGSFPLEPPWIFRPALVRSLLRGLRERARRLGSRFPGAMQQGAHEAGASLAAGDPRLRDALVGDPLVAILRYPGPVLDVIVYRYFVDAHAPHALQTRLPAAAGRGSALGAPLGRVERGPAGGRAARGSALSGGLLFEQCLSDDQRASFNPPPPVVARSVLAAGCCCQHCWLVAHTDRTHEPIRHTCLEPIFGRWVGLAPLLTTGSGASPAAYPAAGVVARPKQQLGTPQGVPCARRPPPTSMLDLLDHAPCFVPEAKHRAYRRHKGRSAQRLGEFTFFGNGYCSKGFYAGWEKADATLTQCLAKCRSEPHCVIAALRPGKTCSRYNSDAGSCDEPEQGGALPGAPSGAI